VRADDVIEVPGVVDHGKPVATGLLIVAQTLRQLRERRHRAERHRAIRDPRADDFVPTCAEAIHDGL
jgi:hypothetical protein